MKVNDLILTQYAMFHTDSTRNRASCKGTYGTPCSEYPNLSQHPAFFSRTILPSSVYRPTEHFLVGTLCCPRTLSNSWYFSCKYGSSGSNWLRFFFGSYKGLGHFWDRTSWSSTALEEDEGLLRMNQVYFIDNLREQLGSDSRHFWIVILFTFNSWSRDFVCQMTRREFYVR